MSNENECIRLNSFYIYKYLSFVSTSHKPNDFQTFEVNRMHSFLSFVNLCGECECICGIQSDIIISILRKTKTHLSYGLTECIRRRFIGENRVHK